MKKLLFFFLSFILIIEVTAQDKIHFPMTFHWRGEINFKTPYELQLRLIDASEALNGQRSRISGYCIHLDSYERWPIEGAAEHSRLVVNCIEGERMVQSFLFEDMQRSNKEQMGLWTDGKLEYQASIQTPMGTQFQDPQLIGFCKGINHRLSILKQDTTAIDTLLAQLPDTAFYKVGKGYNLTDATFAKSQFMAIDFLQLIDSVYTPDSLLQVHSISWQILPMPGLRPYFLEIQQMSEQGQTQDLQISSWRYLKDGWQRVDSLVFDSSYCDEQGHFVAPQALSHFLRTEKRLVFWKDRAQAPWVLQWKENQYISKKKRD